MWIFRKKNLSVCILALGLIGALPEKAAQATALDVGTWNGSGCCGSSTRGYWFTAPIDFTINQLSLPGTQGSTHATTLEVLTFTATPPIFASTTNSFTQLGFWSGQMSVNTNLAIHQGDIVGILGYSGDYTPYRDASGDYATTLGGQNITLTRLLFQNVGNAINVAQEAGGTIGIINMDYSPGINNAVPEPATVALFGLGMFGLRVVRRTTSGTASAR